VRELKTIYLPVGTERIELNNVFRLMREQALIDGRIILILDGSRKVISHTQGGLPVREDIENHFLEFCRHKNVIPTNPATPWRFDYSGHKSQIQTYEISVDEFREFAKPYGFEILCANGMPNRAPTSVKPAVQPETQKRDRFKRTEHPSKVPSCHSKYIVKNITPGPGIIFSSLSTAIDEEWPESDSDWEIDLIDNLPGPVVQEKGMIERSMKISKRQHQSEPDWDEEEPNAPSVDTSTNDDSELASLFDPVKIAELKAMFPDEMWEKYAERADRNGLKKAAKTGRALFNPYLAARWWLSRRPAKWTWRKCLKRLGNNLPVRSFGSASLFAAYAEENES
jgi:hypothetical protein